MNRLLIVDDEHHVVEALTGLFSNQPELEVEVLSAFSGAEALRILSRLRMDVVLLDIQMPGISGMEVLKHIHQSWPACRVIMLTGYSSFSYIYEATQYENTSYLLKTEDNATILNTVTAAFKAVEDSRQADLQRNAVRDQERYIRYLLERDALSELLHVKTPAQRLVGKPLIRLAYASIRRDESGAENSEECYARLAGAWEHVLNGQFHVSPYRLHSTQLMILLEPRPNTKNEIVSADVYLFESIDELVKTSGDVLRADVILLLYSEPVAYGDVARLTESLQDYDIRRVSGKILHDSYAKIIEPSELSSIISSNPEVAWQRTEEISDKVALALYQGDRQSIAALLASVRAAFAAIRSMNYLPAINQYLSLSRIMIGFILSHRLEEIVSSSMAMYPLYHLSEFHTWSDAFQYLDELGATVLALAENAESESTMRLVTRITRMIANDIGGDLSLTRIAGSVNYNSAYVSRTFKQLTGIHLTEYITNARIERAKGFLAQTDDSIQSIAAKTGFDTAQYFSMVFRKRVGMTPREYRNTVS